MAASADDARGAGRDARAGDDVDGRDDAGRGDRAGETAGRGHGQGIAGPSRSTGADGDGDVRQRRGADEASDGHSADTPGRGALLWEYRPPRAHPIVYAGLLLFAVVFVMGSIENLLREQRPTIYAVYALPLLVTLLGLLAWWPSDTRIHAHGVAPSRPLLMRWHRPFLRFDETAAIYPSYYDVTGAFVSPFASSDGKVTQLGLAFESRDGRVETIRFTPSRFEMWQPESRGYLEALEVVKAAWGDRPLVPAAEDLDRVQAEAMLAQANKPFLPFFAIVLLFASAAPMLWLLTWLDVAVGPALGIALIAPVAVSVRSYLQSRRRHAILDRLSKAAEYRRGRAGTM